MTGLLSQRSFAREVRNGPPSGNQALSKAESSPGHAVYTLWVHLPVPPFSARAEFAGFHAVSTSLLVSKRLSVTLRKVS